MFAASMAQPETLELLFEYGPNVKAEDSTGRNALHYCARGGNIQNMRTLMAKLTDQGMTESRTKGGTTPLMAAI